MFFNYRTRLYSKLVSTNMRLRSRSSYHYSDLRLISRRSIVAFLLGFLRLLRFIVFIKYFEIFHVIPDAKVGDRPQQDEEGGREVQKIPQRLAVVLPAIASSVAGPTPH